MRLVIYSASSSDTALVMRLQMIDKMHLREIYNKGGIGLNSRTSKYLFGIEEEKERDSFVWDMSSHQVARMCSCALM